MRLSRCLAIALAISGPLSVHSQQSSQNLDVFPREAAALHPVELASFVAEIVPANGFDGLTWNYLSDGRIGWITDGLKFEGGETSRKGLTRIRVQGKQATIQRRKREELAWTLDLVTTGNAKWGPKFLRLSVECFGSVYDGCSWSSAQALDSPNVKSSLNCEGRFNGPPEVHEVSVRGKAPVLLARFESGGSGGVFQILEIHPIAERAALCSGKSR